MTFDHILPLRKRSKAEFAVPGLRKRSEAVFPVPGLRKRSETEFAVPAQHTLYNQHTKEEFP